MMTYRAETYREDGWIMVKIPELDLLTQARHEGEIELMARDVIACVLDVDIDEVQVELERAD